MKGHDPHIHPPRWSRVLLSHRLSVRQDEVLDDMDWLYTLHVEQHGLRFARWRYRYDVLTICLLGIGEQARRSYHLTGVGMYSNYVKMALRVLRKQKGYTAINITGLSLGMACCMLLYLYVQEERTFDQFHEQGEQIYRVNQVKHTPDGGIESEMPWQPYPLAAALKADLPEVEETVRFMDQTLFIRNGETVFEEQALFADASIFEVFSFPFLQGDPGTALQDINSIVLSPAAARKYFGTEDAVGQPLSVRMGETYHSFTVTGVVAAIPGNSSIRFDYLMPFEKLAVTYSWIAGRVNRWNASSFYVYALVRPGTSAEALHTKLSAFRDTYFPNEAEERRESGRWSGAGAPYSYRFQPLAEIHLNPEVLPGLTPPTNPRYLYILIGIALAILMIACINFTTLAISRSVERSREVGVRKVMGAFRRQLMVQFWGEAALLAAVAMGVGLALSWLFLDTFNTLSARHIEWTLGHIEVVGVLIGILVFTGFVAGFYPALILSGMRPIEALGKRFALRGGNLLTRSLVVCQFVLSIGLMMGTLVMMQQLTYLQEKNLGFDKAHLVVIPTQDLDGEQMVARFRQAIGSRSDITALSGMSWAFTQGYSREGWTYKEEVKRAYVYRVEADFIDMMGIPLLAGRGFDPSRSTDSTGAVLVNEAFVRDFGWDDALGEKLDGFYAEPVVAGVFQDIHFQSLHREVEPMVLMLDPDWPITHLLVRVAPDDIPATLAALEQTWNGMVPEVPFTYSFMDEDLNGQYVQEQRWSRIVGYAGILANLIACLGLFGLAALSVTKRTKEVGIRKALGATHTGVMVLLTKDFLRLVGVALVLAGPLAYYAMDQWLSAFAYHIDVTWRVFALAALVMVLLTIVTVGGQALRAAHAKPVDALRYE